MSEVPNQVIFYRDAKGRSRIERWLCRLRRTNEKAYTAARRLLQRLQSEGHTMKPPKAKKIRGPIWELRHRCGIRIYYWQQERHLFVIAAGEVKQRDKAAGNLIRYAEQAYREWQEADP